MIFDKVEKGSKNIIFVYTECGSREEARDIGYKAVSEKLAISADYWLSNSIYPWQGVLHEAPQWFLFFITQKDKSNRLMEFIETIHSYNIPTIIKTNYSMTNKSYSLWVDNTLNNDTKYTSEEDYDTRKKIDYQFGRLK